MPYPTVNALKKLWDSFEPNIKQLIGINHQHLPDIKKLMTAEAVIDMSLHEIYEHTKYVHNLTETLLEISKSPAREFNVRICYQLWLDILKNRNQNPLKIKHYRKLDSECDFKFSLQLIEGHPNKFKEIQVLNPKNRAELKEAIETIHRLDRLAYGSSFAHLPFIKDKVLSSILESKDTICLLAKDHSNQIVGYSWGILLRDVKTSKKESVNIFWVMDITRDPDFIDKNAQIGDQLRVKMLEAIKAHSDCDFEGYSHLIGHKFHMRIVANQQNGMESIHIGNETFPAKSHLSYENNIDGYLLTHFIKLTKNNYEYPDYKEIKSGIYNALWRAAPTIKDFVLGGIATIGRAKYLSFTHSLHNVDQEEKLTQSVNGEQQRNDLDILKEIILSDCWAKKSHSIFSKSYASNTVNLLQAHANCYEYNFQTVRSYVTAGKDDMNTTKLGALFYKIVTAASTPTIVLDELLKDKNTPKEWATMICNRRNLSIEQQSIAVNA